MVRVDRIEQGVGFYSGWGSIEGRGNGGVGNGYQSAVVREMEELGTVVL